jgi:hypothetical protein
MTPKEKSHQLVQKYYAEVLYGNPIDYSERMLRIFLIKAKTCALIAIDLILTEHPMANDYFYWLDVKEEIEKL